MRNQLRKLSRLNDNQEEPFRRLPPKTPVNPILKAVAKQTRSTNEWLSYIFWALVGVNVLLVGLLLRAITN